MKPDFQWRDEEIYLDNAATTPVDPEVVDAMRPYFEERYGNPETVYRLGREAKQAVEKSRGIIAEALKCKPEEIFFTSGGTEANNWAIKGLFARYSVEGILVSAIEHASVLLPAKWRKDRPYQEIPVDQFGVVDVGALESLLKERGHGWFLVSVQYANNEIGTIQPVHAIAELCKKYKVIFHCDAVQAFGKVAFDVDDVGADMISLSAHKIHGPMGMGALYVKKGTPLEPLIHGGGQERGMRSGTLAVPEIVGFGRATELAMEALPEHMPRLFELVDWMAENICVQFKARRNGHPNQRLPNILSVTIPGMETEVICGIMCSRYGTCMSTGAACSTEKRESHVLKAIGLKAEDMMSTLRISLSRHITREQVIVAISRMQAARNQAALKSLI